MLNHDVSSYDITPTVSTTNTKYIATFYSCTFYSCTSSCNLLIMSCVWKTKPNVISPNFMQICMWSVFMLELLSYNNSLGYWSIQTLIEYTNKLMWYTKWRVSSFLVSILAVNIFERKRKTDFVLSTSKTVFLFTLLQFHSDEISFTCYDSMLNS